MTKSFLSVIIICSLFACSKRSEDRPGEADGGSKKEGTIEMPAGTRTDVNTLSVLSADTSVRVDGKYDHALFKAQMQPVFVTYENGNVCMIGYGTSDNQNKIISASTTAKALVMMTPTFLSLSDDARKTALAEVMKDKDFKALETAVQKVIAKGVNLFDDSNTDLAKCIGAVVKNVASGGKMKGPQIEMEKKGLKLIFRNRLNIFTTEVAIDKDARRNVILEVPGKQIVPTSVKELLEGIGKNLLGIEPEAVEYTLQNNSTYNIRMRTGAPGYKENSEEHRIARLKNCIALCKYILKVVYPVIGKEAKSCLTEIAQGVMKAYDENKIRSSAALYYIVYQEIKARRMAIVQCLGSDELIKAEKYLDKSSDYQRFLDKAFSIVGGAINTGFFVLQWTNSNPAFDTCIAVSRDVVDGCNTVYSGTVKDGSAATVTIQAAKPFQATLRLADVTVRYDNRYTPSRVSFDCGIYGKDIPGFYVQRLGNGDPNLVSFDQGKVLFEFDKIRVGTTPQGNGANFDGTLDAAGNIKGTFTVTWSYEHEKGKLTTTTLKAQLLLKKE